MLYWWLVAFSCLPDKLLENNAWSYEIKFNGSSIHKAVFKYYANKKHLVEFL